MRQKRKLLYPAKNLPVPMEVIEHRIYLIRGQKVMLDGDLAELYQVKTKALNQAVRRNLDRFPDDFMLSLTLSEASFLRSQSVTLEKGRGHHPKYPPLAFTEHGVAMLSSVLNSKRAVQMNILIIRAFVRLREILATHKDLAIEIEKVKKEQKQQGKHIQQIFAVIQKLLEPAPAPRRQFGFRVR